MRRACGDPGASAGPDRVWARIAAAAAAVRTRPPGPHAHALVPARQFLKLAGFDCGKQFDIPSGGQPYTQVCGGQKKVEQACIGNSACGLYTFGGAKDCG